MPVSSLPFLETDHPFGFETGVSLRVGRNLYTDLSNCLESPSGILPPWVGSMGCEKRVGNQDLGAIMSHPFSLAQMLTKVRNGYQARLPEVRHPHTTLCQEVLEVLFQEGILGSYSLEGSQLIIGLKYLQNEPVMTTLSSVSRPGRRVYTSLRSLWGVDRGLGFFILSTPKGVLSDKEARKRGVGGEVLCKVL
jgi:small subunit ribosomal protein S8